MSTYTLTLIGAINLCVGPTFSCFHQLSLAAFMIRVRRIYIDACIP